LEPSLISSLISIFVLILVLFAAYLAARFAGMRIKSTIRSRHMEIVDRIILGRDKALLLVKVGKRSFVVGMTQQMMSTIAEIESSELDNGDVEAADLSFTSIFKESLQRMNIPGFRKKDDGNPWDDGQ
jgi:flagellar protein FliO/FliZ